MRQGFIFFVTAWLLQIYPYVMVSGQVGSQTGQSGNVAIPVFPGASLITSRIVGEEPSCCDFATKDPLDKVIGFYETALKSRAMDAVALAAKYPDMKPQIDMMTSQMPPQMKIRFFVLKEFSLQGKKGAELFEVVSDVSGVHFNIDDMKLISNDAHFAEEWKDAMAQTTTRTDPKPVDPSLLEGALPSTTPSGFEKGEVTSDNSGQPMVSVSYSKLVKKASGSEGSENKYVEIIILVTDGSAAMELTSDMIKPEGQGEKAVRVKGKYDGKESIEKNDYGCIGSQKAFLVNNRFLIEIKANGICDLSVINQVIESMNLDKLPK